MSTFSSWVLMGLMALAPMSAYAQAEGDEETVMDEGAEAETEEAPAEEAPATEGDAAAEAAPAEAAPAAGAVTRFPIRRGFFAEADLGIFFTFGGRNTNRINAMGIVPARSTSNLEPYLGMMFGYDVVSGEAFNVAVGAKLALMMNGGAGIVSSQEAANNTVGAQGGDVRTLPSDYAVWQTGLGVNVDILFTDRLGLGLKVDGGLAILDSDPRAPAESVGGDPLPDSGSAKMTGIFGVGAGITYATLLTGFQVGLDLRFIGILAEGLKAGMAVTIPIKYNF